MSALLQRSQSRVVVRIVVFFFWEPDIRADTAPLPRDFFEGGLAFVCGRGRGSWAEERYSARHLERRPGGSCGAFALGDDCAGPWQRKNHCIAATRIQENAVRGGGGAGRGEITGSGGGGKN